jgi:hypothetical protein
VYLPKFFFLPSFCMTFVLICCTVLSLDLHLGHFLFCFHGQNLLRDFLFVHF